MPKRIKNSKIMKKTKRIKSSKKYNRKSRRRTFKAGNGDNLVQCSMCERMVNKDDTLVPSGCLMNHGKAAHRICKDCWWDPKKGFGREDASHRCPGCEKNLPLTPYVKEAPITIDLTKDD